MIDDLACRWAAAIDRGLDPAEQETLALWLAEDRRHRGALLRAQATLSLLDRGRALAAGEDDRATGFSRRRLLGVGGAALAASLAGFAAFQLWLSQGRIDTGTGEIRRMPLADGSLAVMNSQTRLRVDFTPERRNVEVAQGEAWFEVAHNPARPFVVSSGGIRVQAVGTAFDVRRHADGAEVIVTKGVVKVWSVDGTRAPVHVSAGNRVSMKETGVVQIASLTPAMSDQQLAWRDGRIVLDDMTLAEAAAAFNRYNGDRLEVDASLADRKVVGWFRTDDMEGFANASAAMVGGRVEHSGSTTRIVP